MTRAVSTAEVLAQFARPWCKCGTHPSQPMTWNRSERYRAGGRWVCQHGRGRKR